MYGGMGGAEARGAPLMPIGVPVMSYSLKAKPVLEFGVAPGQKVAGEW